VAWGAGTEAAVSHWERGKRAPEWTKFRAIASALREAGAEESELGHLQRQWEGALLTRLTRSAG
jgi:hypothetical protein